jgi:hypothetical protein
MCAALSKAFAGPFGAGRGRLLCPEKRCRCPACPVCPRSRSRCAVRRARGACRCASRGPTGGSRCPCPRRRARPRRWPSCVSRKTGCAGRWPICRRPVQSGVGSWAIWCRWRGGAAAGHGQRAGAADRGRFAAVARRSGTGGVRAAAFLKVLARDRLAAACDRHAAALGRPYGPLTAARHAVALGVVHGGRRADVLVAADPRPARRCWITSPRMRWRIWRR